MQADRPYVSEPYLSFSIGAPVITVSAPLRGKVPGVIAADLKLDTFSDFVQAQRPGQHGTVMIFDQAGSLIAHPEFCRVRHERNDAPGPIVIAQHRRDQYQESWLLCFESHNVDSQRRKYRDDETGKGFLFRVTKFALGEALQRQHIAAGGPG